MNSKNKLIKFILSSAISLSTIFSTTSFAAMTGEEKNHLASIKKDKIKLSNLKDCFREETYTLEYKLCLFSLVLNIKNYSYKTLSNLIDILEKNYSVNQIVSNPEFFNLFYSIIIHSNKSESEYFIYKINNYMKKANFKMDSANLSNYLSNFEQPEDYISALVGVSKLMELLKRQELLENIQIDFSKLKEITESSESKKLDEFLETNIGKKALLSLGKITGDSQKTIGLNAISSLIKKLDNKADMKDVDFSNVAKTEIGEEALITLSDIPQTTNHTNKERLDALCAVQFATRKQSSSKYSNKSFRRPRSNSYELENSKRVKL